jgi:hypothetical protein
MRKNRRVVSPVPIDAFSKRQHRLIVESLKEMFYSARLEKIVKHNIIRAMDVKRLRDYFGDNVGIVAGDESIPKKAHELEHVQKIIHIYYGVYIRGVGDFECILNSDISNSIPLVNLLGLRIEQPNEDDYFVARRLSNVSISLSRLYNPVLYNKIKRVKRVLEDQWRVDKQLNLLRLIIDEAHKLREKFKLVLALMDGSILPWELNMDIAPGSRFFIGLPDDLVDAIVKKEKEIMHGFNELLSEVYNSNGIVLVGAVKKSHDTTLQSMVGREHDEDAPDQVLLSDIMEKDTVLKIPFEQHRFRVFMMKLNKFGIRRSNYTIATYYVRHRSITYPLKLEVLVPRGLPTNVAQAIPHLLTYLVVESDRHTYINKPKGDFLKTPTLLPIHVVDEKVNEKGIAEIAESAYVLDKEWKIVSERLVECAYSEGECRVPFSKSLGGGDEGK